MIGPFVQEDVSPNLVASAGGQLTAISVSHCAIGDGVNADNSRRCIEMLIADGYDGVLSLECEGRGGPMIEKARTGFGKTYGRRLKHAVQNVFRSVRRYSQKRNLRR